MKSAPRETIPTSIVTPLRRRHTGQLETMPFFSWNPQGERFCPLSLMVRTPPFHGGDSGSIPGEDVSNLYRSFSLHLVPQVGWERREGLESHRCLDEPRLLPERFLGGEPASGFGVEDVYLTFNHEHFSW